MSRHFGLVIRTIRVGNDTEESRGGSAQVRMLVEVSKRLTATFHLNHLNPLRCCQGHLITELEKKEIR